MDITDALAPTSDQLDAIELVNPRTFTIDTGSRLGSRDGKTVAEIRLCGRSRGRRSGRPLSVHVGVQDQRPRFGDPFASLLCRTR